MSEIDPMEACERVATGLFNMADQMQSYGGFDVIASQLRLAADSIESDRDLVSMQTLAMMMIDEVQKL